MGFFDVNNIAFTILNYPMSYIELFGTIFYLLSVILIARKNILTWPVGIISVVLYLLLFWQIRLYSDTLEQVYYLFASVYGWWHWVQAARARKQNAPDTLPMRYSNWREFWVWLSVTLIGTMLLGSVMSQIHLLLPQYFPQPAAYPFPDAFTTIMSFVAMWLMARKRTESWIYWIIVDVIGIGLYYIQGVRFIALLYVILLVMAAYGLRVWNKTTKANPARVSVKSAVNG